MADPLPEMTLEKCKPEEVAFINSSLEMFRVMGRTAMEMLGEDRGPAVFTHALQLAAAEIFVMSNLTPETYIKTCEHAFDQALSQVRPVDAGKPN